MHSVAYSHIGCVRKNNEDNFYLNGICMYPGKETELINSITQNKNCLYSVSDGMGGENSGEKASSFAIAKLKVYHDIINTSESTIEKGLDHLGDYIINTNESILNSSQGKDNYGMGCTITVLYICGNDAAVMSMGDSRAYLIRKGSIRQLTVDNTEADMLARLNILDKRQSREHKGKYRLLRFLGMQPLEDELVSADVTDIFTVEKDDVFLLCSDGLTDAVEDMDILKIVIPSHNVEEMAVRLVDKALENGGEDNITVVIVKAAG